MREHQMAATNNSCEYPWSWVNLPTSSSTRHLIYHKTVRQLKMKYQLKATE
ncbi:12691_t:CDS:2 [Ambispora gerdemannii]|uniref:12691_t:CDS:1 n=1 Tax=Ambispora gerdemannii TaxID=144530 RepID=A0A9N9BQE8_9GLOM|nr:12691_t:CDS:2 [Ambispora gerdemannii]